MSKELNWICVLINNEDAIKSFDAEAVKEGFVAALEYARTWQKPSGLSPLGEAVFYILKSGADLARKHWENTTQRGLKGAEARWHTTPKPKAEKPKIKPTEPQNEPQKEAKSKKFVKPTLEEVRDYCKERKNDLDPEYFYDFQEARNWYLSNGKKMVDWKATIRTWERNNYSSGRKKEEDLANDTSNYGGSDFLKYLKSPD